MCTRESCWLVSPHLPASGLVTGLQLTLPSLMLHGCGVASPSVAGGFVETIAVKGDTIVAVGTNGEIDTPCRPSSRVADLAEQRVSGK
jgi:hypothetical protein